MPRRSHPQSKLRARPRLRPRPHPIALFPLRPNGRARVTQPDSRTFQQLWPVFKLGHCVQARPRFARSR
jgi:hypothetical protein